MATPVATGRGSLITSNTPAGPEQKIASAWAPLAEKSGPLNQSRTRWTSSRRWIFSSRVRLIAVPQAPVRLVQQRVDLGAASLGAGELGRIQVEVETQDLGSLRVEVGELAELAAVELVRLHRPIALLSPSGTLPRRPARESRPWRDDGGRGRVDLAHVYVYAENFGSGRLRPVLDWASRHDAEQGPGDADHGGDVAASPLSKGSTLHKVTVRCRGLVVALSAFAASAPPATPGPTTFSPATRPPTARSSHGPSTPTTRGSPPR